MQVKITSEYLTSQGLSPTFQERFWSKVAIIPYDKGCWIWTASTGSGGYGQIGRWKECDPPVGAHVASWILNRGPVPYGVCVLHKCDNPICVNPDHLFLGSMSDNTADMMRKGRHVIGVRHRHEKNHNSKLNWDKVAEIRRLRSCGNSYRKIAEKMGVSQSLARQVGAGIIWNH